MIRKSWLYAAGKSAWLLLVIAVAGATYFGVAEPYLSRSAIPGPPWVLVAAAVVAGVLGWGVLAVLETRSWVSAGRRADLAASGGGGILRKPELTGEVRGRPVRAHTRKKTTGSGESKSKRTYTVVEADLDEATETGLILGRTDGSGTVAGDVGTGGNVTLHRHGNYAAAEGSEGLAAGVLTERTRRELDGVSDLGMVFVGGASSVLPDMGSSMVGSLFATVVDGEFPGDDSTVATETKGLVLDGGELRARVEALAAVADAFEEATTDDEWGASEFGRLEDEA